MKGIRILSVVMAFVMICSLGTIGVYAAETNDENFEEALYDLADQYGFEVTYIETTNARNEAEEKIIPIASFDSIEDFERALETGEYKLPSINNSPEPIAIQGLGSANANGINSRASGAGNRHLADITLGLDLYATISYTYNMIDSNKYYTSFTNFVPYFSGLNIGYQFDLTTWSGTVCSSISYSDGQWYYVPASSGRGYYVTWGGNISWGIEIGGALIGLSDYMGSWFLGMGDFADS